MMFKIEKIRRDGGTQIRESINPTVVDEYAESWKLGSKFPKVTVFHDGTNYWLADGFHRIEGAIKAGLEKIDCDVRPGTIRDAILWACGCNERHGLRRSRKDRKAAIMKLLNDEEWHKWSDSEIARQCDVSHTSVYRFRPESHLHNVQVTGEENQRTFIDKHGNVGMMNVANIGCSASPVSSHNGTPDSAPSASAVATEEPPDPVSDPADDDRETTEEVSEAASQPESSPDPVTPVATKQCPCCHGTGRVPIDFEEHAHS